MDIVFLVSGTVLGFFIGWFYYKSITPTITNQLELEKINQLDKEKSILNDRLIISQNENEKIVSELLNEREKVSAASQRLARAEEAFRNMQEKLSTQKVEMEDLQKRFSLEFENIANKILDEKSKKFTETNKTNMDGILLPLKEKIIQFEKKVEESYDKELRDKISLREEVKKLYDLNNRLSEEANNLTRALKGDNKKQGNWGEVILEKVLERSGLIKDQEYKTQVSITDEAGKRFQPDVVIYLPDNKHIIIDAKVSLIAYESLVNCETEEERQRHSKDHIISIRTHIKSLSEKNYQSSVDFNSPDFVLLFVPIESSFSIAVQADNELFHYAWERKIVIVSPSTLLATLRTISSIWKQERQTRNAFEIAEQSGRLYDKFVGFVEDMIKIGERLNSTQKAYDDSMKKLNSGSGNILNRIENIKKLGARNSKTIPQKLFIEEENEKSEE